MNALERKALTTALDAIREAKSLVSGAAYAIPGDNWQNASTRTQLAQDCTKANKLLDDARCWLEALKEVNDDAG